MGGGVNSGSDDLEVADAGAAGGWGHHKGNTGEGRGMVGRQGNLSTNAEGIGESGASRVKNPGGKMRVTEWL